MNNWNGPTARYPALRLVEVTREIRAASVDAVEIEPDFYIVPSWFVDPNWRWMDSRNEERR